MSFAALAPELSPNFLIAAKELGGLLVERKIGLVYGGARIGLMGAVAKSAPEPGGEVIGVIPRSLLEKEVAFTDLSDLRVVDSMHERKAAMAGLSDGFIAMPGGLGTIEEFFEALTWAQLDIHRKPCGLLNVSHYYDPLIDFIDRAVEQEFIQPINSSMMLVDESPAGLLDKFGSYKPQKADKAAWALQLMKKSVEI